MKLIEALEVMKQNRVDESPTFEIQLACGFTPLHFSTFLGAHLRREFPGHQLAISTGTFGDLPGNLERLAKAQGSTIVAVIEWQDLDPRLGIRLLGGWNPSQLNDVVQDSSRPGNQGLDGPEDPRREECRCTCTADAPSPAYLVHSRMVLKPIGMRLTRHKGNSIIEAVRA